MSEIIQRIACKAVIVHEGKVLVLREASTYADGTATGRWTCPGGRLEPGEPFATALVREAQEETGLRVTVGEPLHVDEWFPTIQGESNQIVAVYFLCELTAEPTVQLSEEHDAFRWIDLASLPEVAVMPAEQKALGKFFALQNLS